MTGTICARQQSLSPVRPDASRIGVVESLAPQVGTSGRRKSRCRHARATPQPVASAATLPRTHPIRASIPAAFPINLTRVFGRALFPA
jgi:hypothetical protein